jgi:tRNA/tmRNA/rRNA uracil-C5-methylase (TrmA/RlmC/RlmD family)
LGDPDHGRQAVRRLEQHEFFDIGIIEVAALMKHVERLGHPHQRERALDFGCGLGRITRALAQHFDESVGVDISEDMVRRAREPTSTHLARRSS